MASVQVAYGFTTHQVAVVCCHNQLVERDGRWGMACCSQ